ncbi:tRNA uridine-5-carboxymethylaminomethyl(34) synthesis GTPase MnmE [Spiroplasma chrysopicola]|uniref:tRNA modification GTPase MnmE n=1 Tax=Spiroplasma chrysopicola DF-1 TaxID=1276227 RepID=R4U2J3_9MOLU|nr:tRNA uridine-5-carboxymethylaminomethyl(34) synthesis GTPase MnmE [Spiroplasma chrysopicola]AGM25592.1 tRNA modification GTPase TrmE [Spiroplasma chrysopicola DF-1]
MISDTIVAPATALVKQAVAIIRLSGPDAYQLINKVFSKKVEKKENQITFGYIKDDSKVIDQVLIMSFVAPHSFTGEDVIEINCHGGVLVTTQIISLLIKKGARFANPGEFSQRAFLNNKINLIQAEAINDLVNATNETSLKFAINNLQNSNLHLIKKYRDQLLDIIANIEVNIDYPEYDGVGDVSAEELTEKLVSLKAEITRIIKLSKIGKIINDGINVLILGEPNVGKSSLLNALMQEEKAIVSNEAGTTRDIVEGKINLGPLTLNIIDTAGIRDTVNEIEKIGISKAKNEINRADLVLIVIDSSRELSLDTKKLLTLTADKQRIIVFNKIDLIDPRKLALTKFKTERIALISTVNNNIEALVNQIMESYYFEELTKNDSLVLVNLNQISLLEKVENFIKNAYNNIVNNYPVDIVNVDLHSAWYLLGDLIGENYDDNLLNTMFSKYCLGK